MVGGAPAVVGGHRGRFVGGDIGECNRLGDGGVGGVVWEDRHCVDSASPLEGDVDFVGQCKLRIGSKTYGDAFLLELVYGEKRVLVVWNEEDVGDYRCHRTVVGGHDAWKVSNGVAVDGLAVASCEDLRTGA